VRLLLLAVLLLALVAGLLLEATGSSVGAYLALAAVFTLVVWRLLRWP